MRLAICIFLVLAGAGVFHMGAAAEPEVFPRWFEFLCMTYGPVAMVAGVLLARSFGRIDAEEEYTTIRPLG